MTLSVASLSRLAPRDSFALSAFFVSLALGLRALSRQRSHRWTWFARSEGSLGSPGWSPAGSSSCLLECLSSVCRALAYLSLTARLGTQTSSNDARGHRQEGLRVPIRDAGLQVASFSSQDAIRSIDLKSRGTSGYRPHSQHCCSYFAVST